MAIWMMLGLEVMPLPNLATVKSVCRWGDKVYIGGAGGVGILSFYTPMTLTYALATSKPVSLAAPDPTNGDVYFIADGVLYRWNPGSPDAFRLANLTGTSLGVGSDNLYVDGKVYTKSGSPTTGDPSRDNVVWCGARVNAKRGDQDVLFLSPYYLPTFEVGNVEMTVFYPDMRDMWVGTDGRGLYLYRTESWMLQDSVCPTPPLPRVYALDGDSASVWAGGPAGASRLCRGYWLSYNGNGRMFWCSGVNDVFARDSVVLLATECGLMRRDGENFDLAKTARRAISVSAAGERVWVGTEDGLFWTTTSGSSLSEVIGLRDRHIHEILPCSWGTLVLTDMGAYLVSETLSVSVVQDERAFLTGELLCGFVMGDTAWVIGNGGFACFDGQAWNYLNLPFSPVSQRAWGADGNGKYLAVATENGSYFYYRDEKRWERATTFYGLPSDFCWDVLLLGDSALVATDAGLARMYLNR